MKAGISASDMPGKSFRQKRRHLPDNKSDKICKETEFIFSGGFKLAINGIVIWKVNIYLNLKILKNYKLVSFRLELDFCRIIISLYLE